MEQQEIECSTHTNQNQKGKPFDQMIVSILNVYILKSIAQLTTIISLLSTS